jgi:hypothetical protein
MHRQNIPGQHHVKRKNKLTRALYAAYGTSKSLINAPYRKVVLTECDHDHV